jgi:hypothetical protein
MDDFEVGNGFDKSTFHKARFPVTPASDFIISRFHEIGEIHEISPSLSFHRFIVSVDFIKSGPIS